jgi:hypothetical protein
MRRQLLVCVLLLLSVFMVPMGTDAGDTPEEDTRAGANWLTGWEYRKSHTIDGATNASTDYPEKVIAYYNGLGNLFYEMTDRSTTISGNPTDTHGFHPVHRTVVTAVNKVVDGSSRKYLGYDSNETGAEIRLYYTDDLNGTWTGYSGNPILGPNANWYRCPSVTYNNSEFQMFLWNRTGQVVERWDSSDGITFTYQEDVVSVANQFANIYIWLNPNDSLWYLYYTDYPGGTKTAYVRSDAKLENLDSASGASTGLADHTIWAVMYLDSLYWFVTEALTGGTWYVHSFSSISPDSGLTETGNSPVLIDDEACPRLVLSDDSSVGYLYSNRDDGTWYQEDRMLIWNMVDLEAHSDTDFGDVRFTDDDGDTELDYWLEDKTDSDHAVFWVEVADDLNSTQIIYIYYGKTGETTTSNGNNTFLLFDHFLGTGLDAGTWTSSGDVTVASSIVTAQDPNTGTPGLFYSSSTFGAYNISLRSRAYIYNVHYIAFGLRTTGAPIDMATFDKVTAGNYHLRTADEGATTTTTIANDANWRILELYWIDGSVKFLKNDTIIGRHTANIPDEVLPVRTSAQRAVGGTTARIDIDWLFVRSYVDSEPWHGAWGSEESATPPPVVPGTWVDILPVVVKIEYEYDIFSNVRVRLVINESYPVMQYFVWRTEDGRSWITFTPYLNFTEDWSLAAKVPLYVEVRNIEGVSAEVSTTVQINHWWLIILILTIVITLTVVYLYSSKYTAIIRKKLDKEVNL